MEISLSTDIDHISWQELARLFELAPLGKKREPEKVEIAFRNSLLRVFAFHGTTLVGAGRALSDGVWRAAIYDVAVLPEYQGKGIGSMIICHLVDSAKVDVIMLYAVPGKSKFYERFGFRKMATAMAITPNEEEARKRGLIE
jgi:ribosomal protein S18 acetylase RimI-like enzyme